MDELIASFDQQLSISDRQLVQQWVLKDISALGRAILKSGDNVCDQALIDFPETLELETEFEHIKIAAQLIQLYGIQWLLEYLRDKIVITQAVQTNCRKHLEYYLECVETCC